MRSILHGPYELGYTRGTMGRITSREGAIHSQSLTFRYFGLAAATRPHEAGGVPA